MKLDTWYDVKCSKCGVYISEKIGMMESKKEINNFAKKMGWKYVTRLKENICPNCLSKDK